MPTRPPATARVRAPELSGSVWLNTGGAPTSLHALRGKVVVLDFWTFCCVNCLHVLDELREVERDFADVLVTVGVHSPKFAHEADDDAVAAAVARYGVRHPVLNDPELATWQAYAVRAWPTLVVVDPEGHVVAHLAGEGHGPGLRDLVGRLVAEHETKGTLRRGPGPYVPPAPVGGELAFPAGAVLLPDAVPGAGHLLVADAGHGRIAELDAADPYAPALRTFGEGELAEPQGLAVLPAAVRDRVGYDVVVADTVHHRLAGLRLADGRLTGVAGSGRQRLVDDPVARDAAGAVSLSSPWDVVWHPGLARVVVAMAGVHQLWAFDPVTGAVGPLAGTGGEGLRDGGPDEAWFAQPSALAVDGAGTIWVADAETSALRAVEVAGGRVTRVRTAVGAGLFDFGFRDGPVATARLQHPLGVAVLPDGAIAVADTYNGAVRRVDPGAWRVTTLAQGLDEPVGLVRVGDALLVVESGAHRLVALDVPAGGADDAGAAGHDAEFHTRRPATALAPGAVRLTVSFTPPTGQHLDDRWGEPTQLTVSATPPGLLTTGGGTGQGLARDLVLDPAAGGGVLHVTARAAACDGDPVTGEVPEFAACHVYQQDWGIPVRLDPAAPAELGLALRGVQD